MAKISAGILTMVWCFSLRQSGSRPIFFLSAGAFVSGLTDEAIAAGERIGTVIVDTGNTVCQVPYAPDYLRKIQ